jgi:hypothetical protein
MANTPHKGPHPRQNKICTITWKEISIIRPKRKFMCVYCNMLKKIGRSVWFIFFHVFFFFILQFNEFGICVMICRSMLFLFLLTVINTLSTDIVEIILLQFCSWWIKWQKSKIWFQRKTKFPKYYKFSNKSVRVRMKRSSQLGDSKHTFFFFGQSGVRLLCICI